jgi:hypothetical protein
MNSWTKFAALVAALLLVAVSVHGQENSKPTEEQRTPLKITIVLHEFNGNQEIASLPYEVAISAAGQKGGDTRGSTRVGTRIPVMTEKGNFTYVDIGTNFDCHVSTVGEGRYRVESNLDRSSVSVPDAKDIKARNIPADSPENPRINSLRLSFDVILRDGESQEASTATDPLTGHLWKVEIRLKVVKS